MALAVDVHEWNAPRKLDPGPARLFCWDEQDRVGFGAVDHGARARSGGETRFLAEILRARRPGYSPGRRPKALEPPEHSARPLPEPRGVRGTLLPEVPTSASSPNHHRAVARHGRSSRWRGWPAEQGADPRHVTACPSPACGSAPGDRGVRRTRPRSATSSSRRCAAVTATTRAAHLRIPIGIPCDPIAAGLQASTPAAGDQRQQRSCSIQAAPDRDDARRHPPARRRSTFRARSSTMQGRIRPAFGSSIGRGGSRRLRELVSDWTPGTAERSKTEKGPHDAIAPPW